MTEYVCRCGHGWYKHNHSASIRPCMSLLDDEDAKPGDFLRFRPCPCKSWDVSRLPEAGERLEFGVHRLNTPEAEAAEAWPSLSAVEARNYSRAKRGADREKSHRR